MYLHVDYSTSHSDHVHLKFRITQIIVQITAVAVSYFYCTPILAYRTYLQHWLLFVLSLFRETNYTQNTSVRSWSEWKCVTTVFYVLQHSSASLTPMTKQDQKDMDIT